MSYLTMELIIINRVNRSGGIINEMQSDHTLNSKRRTTGIGMYREMLVRYVFPHKKLLAALTVLLLFSIGLQLINPQIIRYFIDTAQGEGSLTSLYYAAGFLFSFHCFNKAFP